jgi:hypothetical protein
LPTASIFTESSEEIFPGEWHFVTKLGPQVSPFPVPIFGVNKGPFTVAKVTGPGSYRLQTLEGEDISNWWNVDQLC